MRHYGSMKSIFVLWFLFAAFARADEASDRAAIDRVIAALNDPQTPPATLFTSDADSAAELARLSRLDRAMAGASRQPWSEVTRPRIVSRAIRFITAEVALADAAETQYGSVILARSVPVLLVMKKEGNTWRIAALRVGPAARY
jgi:hypothetical protein